jgi:hypothetical protein
MLRKVLYNFHFYGDISVFESFHSTSKIYDDLKNNIPDMIEETIIIRNQN